MNQFQNINVLSQVFLHYCLNGLMCLFTPAYCLILLHLFINKSFQKSPRNFNIFFNKKNLIYLFIKKMESYQQTGNFLNKNLCKIGMEIVYTIKFVFYWENSDVIFNACFPIQKDLIIRGFS